MANFSGPFDPAIHADPFPWYQMMRDSQPVLYLEDFNIWMVFRYQDVKWVLTDHENFSSDLTQSAVSTPTSKQRSGRVASVISTDPPRHTVLRSLVNKAFTPRAVTDLGPRIQQIADELLDRATDGQDTMDYIGQFSYPLPVIVIAELMGIPSTDRELFKVWSDAVVASADTMLGGSADANDANREMAEYFRHIIGQRRRNPQSDLISALLAAEANSVYLNEDDILAFCWLLLVAGNETTTNLIGNTLLTLTEQPAIQAKVQEQPELLPSLIEESLRYRSPVQSMFRRTTAEVNIAGSTIPPGSRVIASIGSANRDDDQFADAQSFEMNRNPNPHLAFGHGVHFCLGAPLARLEARIALAASLRHFQHVERVNDHPLPPQRGFIVHGVQHLPIHFANN